MDFTAILDILKRRRWLIATVTMIGFALAAFLLWMTPKQYSATSQVLVMSPKTGAVPVTNSIDMQTLAVSTSVAEGVKRDLNTNASVEGIQSRITAKVMYGSNVMPISFMDRTRKDAVLGANATADELAKYYRQIAFSHFGTLTGFLQKQLNEKRAQIMQVDAKLRQAAVKDPYNADADAATSLAQHIVSLQQQRDTVQASLIGDQAQLAAQKRQIVDMAPVIHSEKTSSDPLYQKIRAQEAADAAQLALVQAQYKGTYPGLAGLRAQVAHEKQQLAAAEQSALTSRDSASPSYANALAAKGQMQAKAAADGAQLQAIDEQIAATEDHLQSLPGVGEKLADLRRQRDLLLTEYQALATHLTDTLAAAGQEADIGSIAVIDRARVASSAIDKHAAMAIIGSVLGFLILAFGLAFLLEVLDSRIRTAAAIETLYGRPVIGTVTPG